MAHESFEDPAGGGGHERALRQRQGRPRGAARRGRALHAGHPGADRLGRLADDRLPHPGRPALLRRHLLPADRARRAARVRRSSAGESRTPTATAATTWSRPRARWAAGWSRARAARPPTRPSARRLVDDALVGLARQFDPAHGGFGGAPKFPPSLALEFLLRRVWARPDDRHAREMAEITLRRMAAGGMYDQVGGGFHRYSVDAVWLVPHFEKMLYDNALLARVYSLAWRLTGEPLYRRVAEETLDYLLREMRGPDGRLLRGPGRGHGRGRGRVLHLDPGPAGRRPPAGAGPRRRAALRGHPAGQLRGGDDPQRRAAGRGGLPRARAATPSRSCRRPAARCTRPGPTASPRRATARC